MKAYMLLVEENQGDAEFTQATFNKNRIVNEIVVLRDGAQACAFLFDEDRGGRPMPQVILLNLKLPAISGLEVLERIRRDGRTRLIPTLVLTTNKQEEDLLEGRFEDHGYVRKPVDFDEFVEALGHMGLYWLLLREPAPPDTSF